MERLKTIMVKISKASEEYINNGKVVDVSVKSITHQLVYSYEDGLLILIEYPTGLIRTKHDI